jgi:hypothetical protein
MKHKVFLGIAIRIIILFTTAMLLTFIPNHLQEFFGDVYNENSKGNLFSFSKNWDWGIRHYWYFWMMVSLFLLSLLNMIMYILDVIENHNKTDKQ